MVYTCAYFQPDWHDDLAHAQHDKLDMICRKLRLKPGERLLDIGCGWGALICHAAQHYGVTRPRRHAVGGAGTPSPREKIARLGLQDRVTIELRDYSHARRRSSTRSRRSACSSMSASPTTRAYFRPCIAC